LRSFCLKLTFLASAKIFQFFYTGKIDEAGRQRCITNKPLNGEVCICPANKDFDSICDESSKTLLSLCFKYLDLGIKTCGGVKLNSNKVSGQTSKYASFVLNLDQDPGKNNYVYAFDGKTYYSFGYEKRFELE
jgi:hypothetical protein